MLIVYLVYTVVFVLWLHMYFGIFPWLGFIFVFHIGGYIYEFKILNFVVGVLFGSLVVVVGYSIGFAFGS